MIQIPTSNGDPGCEMSMIWLGDAIAVILLCLKYHAFIRKKTICLACRFDFIPTFAL